MLRFYFMQFSCIPPAIESLLRESSIVMNKGGNQPKPIPSLSTILNNRKPLSILPLPFRIRLLQNLAEQGQNTLVRLVGLSKHCLTSLSQNLVVGVSNHLGGHIRVADSGLSTLRILHYVVQVVDGVL